MINKNGNFEPMQRPGGKRTARLYFNYKGVCVCSLMFVLVLVLQTFDNKVQGNPLHQAKKTLKLLQSPSSLVQLEHKRHTREVDDSDYYDDNYDVLPDNGSQRPTTFEEHVSAKAKKVAESFTNMWQSLSDSIHHCFEAVRTMFSDVDDDENDENNDELTPEQEQLRRQMEEKYRSKKAHENEV